MRNVRELLVTFGFKTDTTSVSKFNKAVEGAKALATTAAAEIKKIGVAAIAAGREAADGGAKTDAAVSKVSKSYEGLAKTANASTTAMAAGFDQAIRKANELGYTLDKNGRMRDSGGKYVKGGFNSVFSGGGSPPATEHETPTKSPGGKHGGGGGLMGLMGGLGHHMAMLGAGYVGFQAAEGAVEHFAEFQQNMQKAGAAMFASAEQIKSMTAATLQTSATLGFSARQASEGMIELGSAGFESDAATKMLPTAMKLARAGLIDPKESTELLSQTMRGFYGNDASKAEHTGDVLARVHDVGGVKMPALLESMKYVAPAAKAMGQSLEDIGTITALLGRGGITGSLAGNAMKSMLVKLAAPTSMGNQKLADAGFGDETTGAKGKHNKKVHMAMVKELHLVTEDAKGDMLPMVDIMKQLVIKMAGMGNKRKATILKDMFGLEDIPQAMVLVDALGKNGGKAFEEVAKKIHNTSGALDRMNAIMQQGLTPAWQRMFAKAEVFVALLMEKLAPTLTAVMDGIGGIIDGMTQWITWFNSSEERVGALNVVLDLLKLAFLALLPLFGAAALAALPALFMKATTAIQLATAASWEFFAANIEWAAIIALVLIAILVFQDLYVQLNGGASAFERLYNGAAKWLGKLDQMVRDTIANILILAGLIQGKTAWGNDAASTDGKPLGLAVKGLGAGVGTGDMASRMIGGRHALAGVAPHMPTGMHQNGPVTVNSHNIAKVEVHVGSDASPHEVTSSVLDGIIAAKHADVARGLPIRKR